MPQFLRFKGRSPRPFAERTRQKPALSQSSERSQAGLSGTDIPSALFISLPGIFGSWRPLSEVTILKSAKRNNLGTVRNKYLEED